MKRLKFIFIFIISVILVSADAAVEQKSFKKNYSALDKLNLPSSRRFLSFKDKKSIKVLSKIAFNSNYKLGERWRSMAVITKNFPKSKEALKGLKHKQWFIRNASILGLQESSKKLSIEWAAKYLKSDKSLIVRSAAVDILSKHSNKRTVKILRDNIDNKLNFRKGQPLWVRKNILQAIYNKSTKDDLPSIMSELNKKKLDPQHSRFLFEALPRISGHTINTTPYGSEQKAWLNWWQNQGDIKNR